MSSDAARARATIEDADDADGDAALGLSPAVLRVLVDNHARFLGFLQRRVRQPELAEEILQDAFVRGISRGTSLRDDESAVAWFYRLLRNALADRFRHEDARRRALEAFAQDEDATGASSAQSSDQPSAELQQAICACLSGLVETLKPEYAAALRQIDLGGETLETFAEGAGVTRGNAAVRLHRARQALRRRVEQSCGSCATHGCYQCECRDAHPAPSGG